MAKNLYVQIIGDSRSYSRALGSASRDTQAFGSKSSGVFRSVGRAAAFSAGSAGIGALTIALHAGIDEWTEGVRVAAQTAQVLKTTGGVANVTAKDVDDLATAIQNKSGIDDEAIKTTENLLLGFTNIRNEVGKGNDIFDRATKIVTDYSVRTGKNAAGAAIIFGKALQDPLKNMGALSRAVGGLSAAQKAQIKTMVESGNTIGAQKLLLAELEKRFGGAAEAAGKTLPGQLDILRERFRNLAGQGVGIALAKLEEMKPTFDTIIGVIRNFMDVLKPLATLMFDVIVTPMKVIFALLRGDWSAAWEAAKKPVQDLVAVAEAVWGHLQGVVTTALSAITGGMSIAWTTISTLTASAWTSITGAVTTALNTIANLTRSILATISGIFTSAWNAVQTLTTSAWTAVTSAITTAGTAISSAVTTVWNAVKTLILRILTEIGSGVSTWATTTMPGLLRTGGAAMLGALTTAWNAIKGLATRTFNGIVTAIRGVLGAAVSAATAVGAGIVRGVSSGLTGLVKMVQGWFQSLWAWIAGAARSAAAFAFNVGKAIPQGIWNGISSAAGALYGKVAGFVSGIKDKLEFWHSKPAEYGKWLGTELVKGIVEALKGGAGAAGSAAGNFVTSIKGPLLKGMNTVGQLIIAAAKKYGVDARAALAVAMGEGGIKFGAVGDSGHAFGPFQFNNASGVASGMSAAQASAWANSAKGVEDALRMMADAGAKGLTGLAAIKAIIGGPGWGFERPANAAAQVAKAWAVFKTLGPEVASAVAKSGTAISGSVTAQLRGLANLVKQYAPIIGLEQARGVVAGLVQGQPTLLQQAKAGMLAVVAAQKQAVTDARGAFASAFNGLANAALQAFDTRWAAWVPPAQRLLDKMQIAEQVKQVQEQLATAMSAITGGGAFEAGGLAKQLGDQLATAMSSALSSIAGAKTEEALNKVAAQVQTNVLAKIDEMAATATAKAQAAVDAARTALTAAQAGGDPDAIAAAQAALDTAVGNQKTLEAAILAEKELALGQLLAAEQRRHDAIGATQREGLARQLAELKTELAKHPGEWSKLGAAVQKILGDYNVKLQTAGHAWADKFGDGVRAGIPAAVAAARALAAAVAAVMPSTSSPLKPAKKGPLSFHPRTMGKAWATALGSGLASGGLSGIMDSMVPSSLSLSGSPVAAGRNGMVAAGAGGGGTVVNVTVNGALLGTSVPEVAETIRRELYRTKSRNGSLDF